MKFSTLCRLAFGAAALFAAPERLRAQGGPSAIVSPGDTTINTSATTYNLAVQVTWCSDAPFNNATRTFQLDGVDVSANFTTTGTGAPGCVYGAHSQGTITLTRANDGVHSFWVAIEDVNGWYGGGGSGYTLRWPGYTPPKHDVRVRPVSYAIDASASASRSVQFTITNTGSRPATYNLTKTCVRAATCTGLTPASFSLDTTAAGRSATATVTFTTGSAGDTALVRLKATNSVYSAAVDSASTDVFIAATSSAPSPGVTLAGANDVTERSLCLTIAAGTGAAYECGDLRLAHALPTVTTWGKARTPTLLYNSAHALPIVAVQADVAPGATVPQTVEARVKIGGVQYGYGSWSGSQWAANTARRVTVPVTTALATGVYSYTFEVTYTWSGGSQTVSSASGLLPVVNRSASPLGAGWWLAGLEQLVLPGDGSLFWIGGDGSTRRYASAGTNLWRATNVSRPDSIYLSGSTYVRRLPSGTTVEFDGSGKHVATRPLVGHATYFQYNGSGAISRIVVPTALADGDQTVRYDFTYYADSVVATLTTFGGETRRARALLNAGRLTAIRDPDGTSVLFGYGTGANAKRVESRTDRRNFVTTYSYDAIGHFAGHSLTLTGGQVVAQSFQPAESRGAPGTPNGAAQPVDSAYTLVDGPRTDVTDVSRFWVNRYGAPAKIRNANGYYTTVVFDATWPALATEVRSVGGAIQKAWYNARGLVDSTKTVNFRSTGDVSGTTRYYWNPSFASPDSTKGAGGDITYVGYNTDGTVSYIQPGTDIARRTNVAYYSSGGLAGLYRASTVPGRTERDSVAYDASSGNLRAVWTRKGDSSYTHRDSFGRLTYAASPAKTGVWRGDSTEYDLADNVTWQRSFGPPVSYTLHAVSGSYLSPVPADTLVVHNSYDAEGNVTDVSRWAAPNRTGAPTATNSYLYDGLGRKTSETSSVGADLTLTYDPAGNLIQSQGFTGITSMQYDPLGRLTQRIAEQQSYLRTTCSDFKPWGAGIGCNFSFPLSTTGSLTIPADTATFVYDAAGNTVRADNGSARIRRSYSPSGLVLTDTLRTRVLRYATNSNLTVAQDFASHVYGIRYDYDKAGRRSGLWHPTNLASCGVSCPAQLYAYDTLMNRLTSATDIRGVSAGFQYNTAGQLTDVLFPGSISEHSDYDAEGLPTRRWVGTSTFKYINDTLTYDPVGRVLEAHGRVVRDGQSQDLYNVYSGLGALAEAEHDFSAQTNQLEEFRSDALGNQIESRRSYVRLSQAGDEPAIRMSVYDTTTGFLMHVTSPPDSLEWQEFTHTWSDINGRTEREGGMLGGNSHPGGTDIWQSAQYYDGNGKLAVFEKHIGDLQQASLSNDPRAVSETYRYDAFGRRVLVRSLHDASCTVAGCESTIQRFVWDGDQLLYELRAQADGAAQDWMVENDNPSGAGQYHAPNAYGVVGYIHVGGIDRPLEVLRRNTTTSSLVSFFPQANWRGLYEGGTKDDGSLVTNSINWPGASASAYLGATPPSSPYEWFGSLIAEHADASGLMYRRNRYYDPQTGRFTTPDPIGVAGGLNAYGFAGGDPVNFADPLGLCPPDKKTCEVLKAIVGAVAFTGGSVLGDAVGAAAGIGCGPGFEVCSPALAVVVGRTFGLAASSEARDVVDWAWGTKSHTTGRTRSGPRVRVDWEEPANKDDPGNVHIQGEGPDKSTIGKIYVRDPADLSSLPKALRENDQLKQLINRAFEQLRKFKESQ